MSCVLMSGRVRGVSHCAPQGAGARTSDGHDLVPEGLAVDEEDLVALGGADGQRAHLGDEPGVLEGLVDAADAVRLLGVPRDAGVAHHARVVDVPDVRVVHARVLGRERRRTPLRRV